MHFNRRELSSSFNCRLGLSFQFSAIPPLILSYSSYSLENAFLLVRDGKSGYYMYRAPLRVPVKGSTTTGKGTRRANEMASSVASAQQNTSQQNDDRKPTICYKLLQQLLIKVHQLPLLKHPLSLINIKDKQSK